MKKGFTLIEILAVVTIIGLIFILVIPKIATSLKNKKGDVDTTTNNIVLAAAKSYVQDNHDKFDKTDNNTYCLPISTLTKKEYLESPVKNVTDDVDITNTKSVKITYNKGFKYEIVDKKECEVVYIPPCKSDYCDSDGNGYNKVKYIESTGTQYIDTGYIPNQNTKFEIEFLTKNEISVNSYGCIFGSRQKSGSNEYQLSTATNDSKKGIFRLNNQTYDAGITKYSKMNISYLNNTYSNNDDLETSINPNVFSSPSTLTIFALHENTSVIQYGKLQLYSLKIYDDNNIVRDFIPVIDNENIPCLFDNVEKKCYYNKGSGSFSFKKIEAFSNYDYMDNLSNHYIIKNYLESTGTQYIDTGYIPNQDTEFEIEFLTKNEISVNSYGCIFGSRQSSGSREYQLSTATNDSKKGIFRLNNQTYDAGITKNTRMHISYIDNIYSNNNDLETSINPNVFSSPSTLTIFALNNNNSIVQYGKVQLYSFKIYNQNTLIRDYIPVLNIDTNLPCLFDKLENKCYYNKGMDILLYG